MRGSTTPWWRSWKASLRTRAANIPWSRLRAESRNPTRSFDSRLWRSSAPSAMRYSRSAATHGTPIVWWALSITASIFSAASFPREIRRIRSRPSKYVWLGFFTNSQFRRGHRPKVSVVPAWQPARGRKVSSRMTRNVRRHRPPALPLCGRQRSIGRPGRGTRPRAPGGIAVRRPPGNPDGETLLLVLQRAGGIPTPGQGRGHLFIDAAQPPRRGRRTSRRIERKRSMQALASASVSTAGIVPMRARRVASEEFVENAEAAMGTPTPPSPGWGVLRCCCAWDRQR